MRNNLKGLSMSTTLRTCFLVLSVLLLSIYSSAHGLDNIDAAPGPLKKPAENAVKDVFTATTNPLVAFLREYRLNEL